MRIGDRKGAEQIFIHAQRNWDENIEHDQKIRIGHERRDSIEANSYTELKAEEHMTVIADRKVEVKPDDHLTVGQNQHIKLGTALLSKAGGSFIKLDPGGITISGPQAKINAGGAPGKGSGIGIKPPVLPGAADSDKAGNLLDEVLVGGLFNPKRK